MVTPAERTEDAPTQSHLLIGVAQRLYRDRIARLKFLPNCGALLREPAWDILLNLYIAERCGRSVPVTSACLAAFVAPSTGARVIARLERCGFVERRLDRMDRRRTLLQLTTVGEAQMEAYLESMSRSGSSVLVATPQQA